MKEKLTVGEISALFGLNVQTLHYYESIGLFRSSGKTANGYRYYDFDKVYILASILYMKRIGYPLKQIRGALEHREPARSLSQMKLQAKELDRQWRELQFMEKQLNKKIAFTEANNTEENTSKVQKKILPDRHYVLIGTEDFLYSNEHFYHYPTIVFYEGGKRAFGALLDDMSDEKQSRLDHKTIKAGEFWCGCHHGPYETITERHEQICELASQEGLRLSKKSLDINIIDQFIENDPENYVTEIQFRIL